MPHYPLLLIGKQIEQFRLEEFIAKGAMGMLFRAFDTVLIRTVAIKLISKEADPELSEEENALQEEARKRLIQEAMAAGRLTHPNIVTIHSYGETEEFEYICMEYIRGRTLEDLLNAKKVLDATEALPIFQQILLALEVANEEHIVHRDIKPSNIMITEDGKIKVMDFGIAKLPSLSITMNGTALGTPHYMSPEQISGEKVDIRSDLFSLGAVMYEVLTGQKPFKGENTAALTYRIIQTVPTPPRVINIHIPQDVEHVIKKAMEKDPKRRYQTPKEMNLEIVGIMDKLNSQADSNEDATVIAKAHVNGASANPADEHNFDKTIAYPIPAETEVPGNEDSSISDNKVEPPTIGEKINTPSNTPESLSKEKPESDLMDQPSNFPPKRKKSHFGKLGMTIFVAFVVAFIWYRLFLNHQQTPSPESIPTDSTAAKVELNALKDVQSSQPSIPPAPSPSDANTSQPQTSQIMSPQPTSTPEPPVQVTEPQVASGANDSSLINEPSPQQPIAEQSADEGVQGQKLVESLVTQAKSTLVSDPKNSIKLLEDALAIDPQNEEAKLQLGRWYTFRKDFPSAIRYYQDVLQINNQSALAYFNLAYIYLSQREYDQAIRTYDSCLSLNPEYKDEVLTNLAFCHYKKNEFDLAKKLLNEAIRINTNNRLAKKYLQMVEKNTTATKK
jgi:eukaryotic-like serine/threonine-protein kinase